MLPSFGTTLQLHLFENLSPFDITLIGEKIIEAFSKFLPSLDVRSIVINDVVHYNKEGGIFTPDDFPQRRPELKNINNTISNSLTVSIGVFYNDLDELIEVEVVT